MATECKRWVDTHSKQIIIQVVDIFGQKQLLQVPMLSDLDAELLSAKMIADMNDNEQKFIAGLKKHGYSDAQIEQMKVSPRDCGCGS